MTRVIEGDQSFSLPGVGESHHETSIRQVFGSQSSAGVGEETKGFSALLILEDTSPFDSFAVRIEIENAHVGYLSREDARAFRRRYAHGDEKQFTCNAAITRFTGGGYASEFCVRLDVPLDEQLSPGANARRRADRCISEMLGLVKGILLDGVVTEQETIAFDDWFRANPDAIKIWPGSVLASRLHRMLEDGAVDNEERDQLRALLQQTIGTQRKPETNPTTDLPLDDPPPPLEFPNTIYVFTGEFAYGTRKVCQDAVSQRGGICADRVTRKTNVLVIGCIGSENWAHSSYGRKIETARRWRDEKGAPMKIISEEHWVRHLH